LVPRFRNNRAFVIDMIWRSTFKATFGFVVFYPIQFVVVKFVMGVFSEVKSLLGFKL
jgi:hypothetical protein